MIPEGERRTPVSKAIGMPELDVGGKLLPLQRPGSSDVLPEEEAPKLPTDGLILSPAELAGAVLDGRKTLMVKTRPFEIAGKRCLLIGDRKALGIVTVGKLRDVDLAELNRTVDQHHISEELRAGWAVDRKRWKKGPFYGWTIKVESKFDEPVETDIGPDPQVLARNVELKSVEKKIRPDPTRLFFCARLPDEIRKKLTDLAEELEGIDAAKLDDADHITVLYVPSKGEYSEGDKKAVFSAVQKVLDSTQPIDAKLQGWGYFDGVSKEGEPATALVALIDAPGLADLHVKIKAAISEAGFTEVDDQTHGYVPHATLAYLPVGARIENLPVLDAEFKIEKIELVHSDISEMDLRGVGKNLGDYEHALAGNQGKTEFYKMALQSAPERAGACAVEFFAGRGSSPISGVSGLKHIGVDKDESAVKAYKKKHPKAEVVCGDSVKMLPGGLLIDEDIAIADFDASGKPHDVIKAFFDSVQIGCADRKAVTFDRNLGFCK
jgi:2'-5' RNA ligase